MRSKHDLLHGPDERDIRMVVMGGSAGAIEALRAVLPAFPSPFQVPVVIVLHLGAETSSNWSVVFSACNLPVREAEDKQIAVPGSITIAPPNYHLLLDGAGMLSLSVEGPVNHSRPSIDVLFESAAWAYGERTLGILFSGANADGALGLAAIRRAGGLCWVQSTETSTMPAMPRAGLHAVPEARVLSLSQMADAFRSWNLEEGSHGRS
jgi:two-component system, chemotaxis family, protein-glutamate methylesterase/glutaminase